MLFSIVLICCGAFLFLRELINTRIQLDLFTERWRVPEAMRPLQKRSDLSLAFGHLSAALFGASLILSVLSHMQDTPAPLALPLSALSILLGINLLEKIVFARKERIRERVYEIQEQWHREKHISAQHDHEVNLYRGLKSNLDGVGNAALILAGELLICFCYV